MTTPDPHDGHLSLRDLARIRSRRGEPDDLGRLVAHLLAVSPECREREAELQILLREVAHWDEMVAVVEWREAPALWRPIETLPYAEQLRAAEGNESLHTWGVCRLLQCRSRDTAHEEPALASRLANLAIVISGYLGDRYHPGWALELQALCFAVLGDARRRLGEMEGAEDAFIAAGMRRRRGGGCSPRLAAEAALLEAALRCAQFRIEEAEDLLDQAQAACTAASPGEPDLHLGGEVLALRAACARQRRDLAGAVSQLEQAVRQVADERDPRLAARLRTDLLRTLLAAGRDAEADRLLPELEELALSHGGPLDQLRLRFIRERMAAARLHGQAADRMLRQIQAELLQAGLPADAALSSLDRAGIYTRLNETTALGHLADDLVSILQSPRVTRSVLAAVLELQLACRANSLTTELALDLAARLDAATR